MIKLGVYKHYKRGDEYLVTGVAEHENTNELLVVYKALYGDRHLWTRPLVQFIEIVNHNGQPKPRFEWVREME